MKKRIAHEKQFVARFERLVHTYKDPLYCMLFRMTGQQERAVLLLKEVFIKIYDELPNADGTIDLKIWLYRLAITYGQAQKEYSRNLIVLKDGRAQQLESLMVKLPETERLIFLLRYGGDCSYEEIAEILKIPVATVQHKLDVAKKRMRDEVREARR